METMLERQYVRMRLLRALYESVNGDRTLSVDPAELGDELGLQRDEVDRALLHLRDAGLVTRPALRRLSLTHEGAKRIEEAYIRAEKSIDLNPEQVDLVRRIKDACLQTGVYTWRLRGNELIAGPPEPLATSEPGIPVISGVPGAATVYEALERSGYIDTRPLSGPTQLGIAAETMEITARRKALVFGEAVLEDLVSQDHIGAADAVAHKPRRPPSGRVFIVHGHDEEALHKVARAVEKAGLIAVILREQPNEGRTVIEKFEDYSEVSYAVVLLTPDDLGKAKDGSDLRGRARQNVIFELGFFVGKLGRDRVCALHKGGTEILSDYQGVLWVALDQEDWYVKLGRELMAAGLPVELAKLTGL